MKTNCYSVCAPLVLAVAVMGWSAARAAAGEDCAKTTEALVKADAESVLKIVAEQVAASPGCACEIVKAAISVTNAENDLVAAIVQAAVTAAPDELPTVLACAASAAPAAAGALGNLFADGADGSGKGGSGKGVVGKGVVGKEPVGKGGVGKEIEEAPECGVTLLALRENHPGLSGIYLSPPSGGFSSRSVQSSTGTVTVTRKVTVTRPAGVPTPVTPSVPGGG